MGRKTLQNLRYTLYSINFMMATLGATFIAFGTKWVMFDQRHQKATLCLHISVGGFLIAFGILLFVCVLIGLLVVLRDVRRLQQANNTLVLLLVFVYMDFGIVALTIGNPNSAYMMRLHAEVVNRFRNPRKHTAQFFDFVQTEPSYKDATGKLRHPVHGCPRSHIIRTQFQCCGVDGYEDYDKYYRNTTKFYPKTCCKSRTVCTEPDYKEGCGEKIRQYRWQRFQMSAALSFVFVLVGVSYVVFFWLLKREMQRQMQTEQEIQVSRRSSRQTEEPKSEPKEPETEEASRRRRERKRKENTERRVKEILSMSSEHLNAMETGVKEPKKVSGGRKKVKLDSERLEDAGSSLN